MADSGGRGRGVVGSSVCGEGCEWGVEGWEGRRGRAGERLLRSGGRPVGLGCTVADSPGGAADPTDLTHRGGAADVPPLPFAPPLPLP